MSQLVCFQYKPFSGNLRVAGPYELLAIMDATFETCGGDGDN